MKGIKTEITINAPKEKIWALLSDLDNYQNWNNIITNVKSSLQVDRGFRFKIDIFGQAVPMTAKVHRADENQYLGWGNDYQSWVKMILAAHHYFEIIEISESQCKFVHAEQFYGVVPFVLWPIINKMGKSYERFNESLKSEAEK
ncbi:hypothetical protein A9Q81_10440 [Gammaproteobacteria bacterium 42_54_T18]|nr:hypothetical protein A9Q81_10440 [Gammaproteobacteria bacterium 42_54_T18]